MFPKQNKIEIFARSTSKDWKAWGLETIYKNKINPKCDCKYYIPDRLAYPLNDDEFKKNKARWIEEFKPYAETIESFHKE